MSQKIPRYHAERDSPFFRLRSRAKLADLLFCNPDNLHRLTDGTDYYREFQKPKKDGTTRTISAPREDLKRIQSRIADLLQRIAPPDYLFAPVAGRSYVDNAARHLGARCVRLLDIEDFFPRCTANKVIWFFHKRMECAPDVAAILRALVTREGALPQGSPCSPILAYLCYVDMWEEISRLVDDANTKLSVYADDLTISGMIVPEMLVWNIKKALRRHGHRYKVKKERSRIDRPAEITGVILTPDRLRLPNRQHKKLHEIRRDLKAARSPRRRTELEGRLRGRVAQAHQVERLMAQNDTEK